MEDRFNQRRFVPINVGDELDVKIETVGEKGDGLAKVKGFVIFVPDTKEGQVVKIRVRRVLKKVAFGEVIGEGNPDNVDSEGSQPAEQSQDAPAEAPAEEAGEEKSDENCDPETGICEPPKDTFEGEE